MRAGLTTAPLAEVAREAMVFCAARIAALFLIVLAPRTVPWLLPRLFGYGGNRR